MSSGSFTKLLNRLLLTFLLSPFDLIKAKDTAQLICAARHDKTQLQNRPGLNVEMFKKKGPGDSPLLLSG